MISALSSLRAFKRGMNELCEAKIDEFMVWDAGVKVSINIELRSDCATDSDSDCDSPVTSKGLLCLVDQ